MTGNEAAAGEAPSSGPGAPPRRRRARAWLSRLDAWAVAFLLIGAIAGGALTVVIPANSGIDEFAHIYRLSTIDDGFAIPPRHDAVPADYVIDGCVDSYIYSLHFAGSLSRTEELHEWPCGEDVPAHERFLVIAAEGYPPLPYLPAWAGYRVGRRLFGLPMGLLLARVAQLAVYLALVAGAIALAPWGKPFLFTVGLLPVVLHSASGISADPATMGLALLSSALALRLVAAARSGTRASTRLLVATGVAFVLLGAAKPGYAPMALVLAAVPTAAFGSWRRRLTAVGATLGVIAVTNAAWMIGVTAHLTTPPRPGTDPVAQAEWARSAPVDFLRTVGRTWTTPDEVQRIVTGTTVPVSFLTDQWRAPTWVIVGAAATVLAAVALDARQALRRGRADGAGADDGDDHGRGGDDGDDGVGTGRTWRGAARHVVSRVDPFATLVVVGIAAVTVLGVSYAMALASNKVVPHIIIGIQGRYFLPLAPLVLFVWRRPARPVASSAGPALAVLAVAQAVVLAGYVVTFHGATW